VVASVRPVALVELQETGDLRIVNNLESKEAPSSLDKEAL